MFIPEFLSNGMQITNYYATCSTLTQEIEERHAAHRLLLQLAIHTSLIHSRLHYCNSLVYSTSTANVNQLQSLQNALSRIVHAHYDRLSGH